MEDALNVKLRYEQIIKNLLENEKKGNKSSTLEVVAVTQAKTRVDTMIQQSSLTVSVQQLMANSADKEKYGLQDNFTKNA